MKPPYWKMACVSALLSSILSAQSASAKVCGAPSDPYTIRVNQVAQDRFTFQFCHYSNHGEVCEAIGKGPYSRDQLNSYASLSRVEAGGAVVGDIAVVLGGVAVGVIAGTVFGPGDPGDRTDEILNPIGRLILQVALGVAGTAGGVITDIKADALDPAYYWKRANLLSSEGVLLSGDKCVIVSGIKYVQPIARSLQRMFSTGNDVAQGAPSSSYARSETSSRDGGISVDSGTPESICLASGAQAQ